MHAFALIHGYAVNLTSPIVRRGFGATGGFEAFADDLAEGSAVLFRWGLRRDVAPLALLDPLGQYRFYRDELAEALSPATQEHLAEFLEREQPRVIVAHSMGTTLLHAFARERGLPPSVRAVVLVQSDLPRDADLSVFPLAYNVFCPWDPTLALSATLAGRSRAGLLPLLGTNVINVLLPAHSLPNLHTSALRDGRLRELALGLVGDGTSS